MKPLAESAATSQQASSPLIPRRDDEDGCEAADLTSLRRDADLTEVHFTSHRRMWGWAVILLKTALRRLLTPIIMRQAAYNQTNVELLARLSEQLRFVQQELDLLRQQHLETMQRQQADFAQQIHDLTQQLARRFVERSQQEIDLRELQKNWNEFGKVDPLWAILTWPDKKGNRWDLEEFFSLGREEIALIMKHISSLDISCLRYRKALDFGCGVGRITQALAPYYDEVNGIDISPSMIELAGTYNRYGAKCRYFVNETNDLTLFEDNTFDFIYSIITLQHIKPPYIKGYLKEFVRVLAPGGLLAFQVPSEPGTEALRIQARRRDAYPGTAGVFPQDQPYMEMHSVPKDEVIACLEEHGGKIIQVEDDHSAGPDWMSFRYFVTKP
jgi:ubiquinone/menaquinone biosynthesis C-methylase UbiE